MATLQVYPPSEGAQTHLSTGPFSPITPSRYATSTPTYSESTQSPPTSPLKYPSTITPTPHHPVLPPATDSLITTPENQQPSLAARLHRRKKTYQPPTAPALHASQPHDPLRAARLAWRLQEEYAEQVRIEEEQMRMSTVRYQRQQQREFVRQTGPARSPATGKSSRRKVRSKWQAFLLWFKLGFYRFTRGVRNVFKWGKNRRHYVCFQSAQQHVTDASTIFPRLRLLLQRNLSTTLHPETQLCITKSLSSFSPLQIPSFITGAPHRISSRPSTPFYPPFYLLCINPSHHPHILFILRPIQSTSQHHYSLTMKRPLLIIYLCIYHWLVIMVYSLHRNRVCYISFGIRENCIYIILYINTKHLQNIYMKLRNKATARLFSAERIACVSRGVVAIRFRQFLLPIVLPACRANLLGIHPTIEIYFHPKSTTHLQNAKPFNQSPNTIFASTDLSK